MVIIKCMISLEFQHSHIICFSSPLLTSDIPSPALGGGLDVKAIRLHHGPVVVLVGAAQLRGHGDLVIEIGKAGIRIESAGVKDGLGGFLNGDFLRVGRGGPREDVVNNIFGIAVIAL